MSYTVLLTCAGGNLSAELVRILRKSQRHKLRVLNVDAGPISIAGRLADTFFQVPFGNHPDYVPRMLEILSRERVDLVLPGSDEEALALAGSRREVEATGAQLACADVATLQLVSDKARCFAWLRERGFAVPDWQLCKTTDDLPAAYAHFGHADFVVKPARGRGNRGIFVVRSDIKANATSHSGRELHLTPESFFADHAHKIAALLPVLVCERLKEPCYDIDVLSWQGKPQRVVPRQRLNPEGMPFLGNIIRPDPGLIDLGARVAQALELSWLYDFDVMTRASNSEPVVIEVNPRPSGSMSASVAAGIPLLDDLISLAKGDALPPAPTISSATVLPEITLTVFQ